MIDINYILIALISYLLGSVPFALLYVRFFIGKDMRKFGSKNTGALNTLRIVSHEKGKGWGIVSFFLVFFLDAFKAVLAVIIANQMMPNDPIWATTIATFFSILGHNYSVLLKFKGGRGAASLAGILLYLSSIAFFGWLAILLLFMFLLEIVTGGRISKKFIKRSVSEQIIGRVIGEIYAIWWISLIKPDLAYPVLFGTILIVIAHTDRIKSQIEKMKNKTYFND